MKRELTLTILLAGAAFVPMMLGPIPAKLLAEEETQQLPAGGARDLQQVASRRFRVRPEAFSSLPWC